MLSWDAAREFCENKNSTLPIIRDENIDRVFQRFRFDSYDVTRGRSVLISARARPVNNSVRWHWINGSPSGIDNSVEARRLAAANSWRVTIRVAKYLAMTGGVVDLQCFSLIQFAHHVKFGYCFSYHVFAYTLGTCPLECGRG